MKITLAAVTSSDGYIANETYPDPRAWTSGEDKEFLAALVKEHTLLVMGSSTYKIYQSVKPSEEKFRVVLTSRPEEYENDEIPGQLEFKDFTPEEFVQRYSEEYDSCLLLGGSYVYGQFVSAGLVNELFITVEPIALTHGKRLLPDSVKLTGTVDTARTKSIKLNEAGTILKHIVFKR